MQSVGRTKGDLLRVLSYVTKDGEHNQEMNDVALFKKAADQALRARHRTWATVTEAMGAGQALMIMIFSTTWSMYYASEA